MEPPITSSIFNYIYAVFAPNSDPVGTTDFDSSGSKGKVLNFSYNPSLLDNYGAKSGSTIILGFYFIPKLGECFGNDSLIDDSGSSYLLLLMVWWEPGYYDYTSVVKSYYIYFFFFLLFFLFSNTLTHFVVSIISFN